MPYNLVGGKTWEEFKENINRQLEKEHLTRKKEEENPQKTAASRTTEFKLTELFGRANRKSEYEVYGKQGSIEFQLTDKAHFESKDDFWKYVSGHKQELENRYRELKEEFSRSEKDWRSGNPGRGIRKLGQTRQKRQRAPVDAKQCLRFAHGSLKDFGHSA